MDNTAPNLCRRITERDGGEHDRLDTDIMDWLMREPDRLAASAARIEALTETLQACRAAIMFAPTDILTDTLWVADGTAETVVDMIDAALDAAPRSDGEKP
jgi:hypothetical protein